jgi:hypothetical protein
MNASHLSTFQQVSKQKAIAFDDLSSSVAGPFAGAERRIHTDS